MKVRIFENTKEQPYGMIINEEDNINHKGLSELTDSIISKVGRVVKGDYLCSSINTYEVVDVSFCLDMGDLAMDIHVKLWV